LSGLSRFEFEQSLSKNKISISDLSIDQILPDVDKLKNNTEAFAPEPENRSQNRCVQLPFGF